MINQDEITTGIASASDIDELVSLLGLLFAQEAEFSPNDDLQRTGLCRIIEEPQRGEIIVLRMQNEVVGMTTLLYTISTALGARVALLEDMIVHPRYRNQGLGEQLVNAANQRAITVGCQRITLLTDEDNHAAHRFYQRHGFQPSTMKVFRLHV
jgi:GNAT superfamily N-acetyltransferase